MMCRRHAKPLRDASLRCTAIILVVAALEFIAILQSALNLLSSCGRACWRLHLCLNRALFVANQLFGTLLAASVHSRSALNLLAPHPSTPSTKPPFLSIKKRATSFVFRCCYAVCSH
jgi:hypothetical protein